MLSLHVPNASSNLGYRGARTSTTSCRSPGYGELSSYPQITKEVGFVPLKGNMFGIKFPVEFVNINGLVGDSDIKNTMIG